MVRQSEGENYAYLIVSYNIISLLNSPVGRILQRLACDFFFVIDDCCLVMVANWRASLSSECSYSLFLIWLTTK